MDVGAVTFEETATPVKSDGTLSWQVPEFYCSEHTWGGTATRIACAVATHVACAVTICTSRVSQWNPVNDG